MKYYGIPPTGDEFDFRDRPPRLNGFCNDPVPRKRKRSVTGAEVVAIAVIGFLVIAVLYKFLA